MKIRRIKSLISVILIFSILLTGCGKKQSEEIPELQEPMVTDSAYHPVERGNIENINVEMGTVVPMPYCHFYPANTAISSIEVDIGDYVEAGTVLAYADIDSIKDEVNSMKKQLDNMKSQLDIEEKIYEQIIQELKYRKKAYAEAGASSEAEEIDTQIAVQEENHRYDTMLAEIHRKNLEKEIKVKEELVEDGTLRARHSGYVTYIKDISQSRDAGTSENVVIVSDMNDPYIELKDWVVNSEQRALLIKNVKRIYTKINGQEHTVVEWNYSDDELIYAKVANQYPNFRMKLEDDTELTVGDTIPIYFSSIGKTDVLRIGNDSIYQEDEETYVYVKNESGEQERRNVELGVSDDLYTEVIDGLIEGEPVFYKSDSSVPASYREYTVETSDFETIYQTSYYRVADSISFPYRADFDGRISNIFVSQGSEVKKGDLLYTIDTGGGQAALAAAKNDMKHAEESYKNDQKAYDDQIIALKEQITTYKNSEVPVATDTDAMKEYLYQEEQLSCEIQILSYQKQIAELNYNYSMEYMKQSFESLSEGNDGTGKINVYASDDGVISKVSVREGEKVLQGNLILTLKYGMGDKIVVTADRKQNPDAKAANLGQSVTFQYNGKTCQGECIGEKGPSGKVFITTIDGEVYLTYCAESSGEQTQFYASVEDESIYSDTPDARISFPGILMRDVVTIPKDLIYNEIDKETSKTFQYVWRIEGEELIKQYVKTNETLSFNGMIVILNGIEAGDILAVEVGADAGGEN